MALRGLKDHLKNQFNVSVNEVAHLDSWQRAQLACTTVSTQIKMLQQIHSKLEQYIRDYVDGELIYCELELL